MRTVTDTAFHVDPDTGREYGADVTATRDRQYGYYAVTATTAIMVPHQQRWWEPVDIPSVGHIRRDTNRPTSREWVLTATEHNRADVVTEHPTLGSAVYAAAKHAARVRARTEAATRP